MTEETTEPLLKAAARRISEKRGRPVILQWREGIGAFPHVLRCEVTAADVGMPPTVIVKTPQRAERKARLLNDAASLDFLNRLPESDARFWPRLYASDIAQGFIVEEDFGSHTLRMALSDALPGAAARARSAVEGWAVALGEVAARTRGRAAEFEAIRAPYAPREQHMNFDLANHLSEGRTVLTAAFAALNVSPSSNFDAEYGQVVAQLAAPTPFDAFTIFDSHGDNVLITEDGARLIDFDWGQFRHALIDGTTPRMTQDYPDVFTLPADVSQRAETLYRARLAAAFPEAQDDALWDSAVAFGSTFWAVYYAVGFLPRLLEHDFAPGQEWQTRQLIKVLSEFIELSTGRRRFPALSQILSAMRTAMYRRWREKNGDITPILFYPAFQEQRHGTP